MERHCEQHLGEAFRRPVEFDPELQLGSPGGICSKRNRSARTYPEFLRWRP